MKKLLSYSLIFFLFFTTDFVFAKENCQKKFQNKVIKEVNRKDAIKIGVNLMKTNDILLIAGKGHEKFQDVNGKQIHFDEKLILKKIVQNVRK